MSRDEVESIVNVVKREAEAIDKNATVIPVGGYRRGKPTSGDVDIVLAPSADSNESSFFETLIQKLKSHGNINFS